MFNIFFSILIFSWRCNPRWGPQDLAAQCLPQLRHLSFRGCRGLTDLGLRNVLQQLPQLRHLDLLEIPSLSGLTRRSCKLPLLLFQVPVSFVGVSFTDVDKILIKSYRYIARAFLVIVYPSSWQLTFQSPFQVLSGNRALEVEMPQLESLLLGSLGRKGTAEAALTSHSKSTRLDVHGEVKETMRVMDRQRRCHAKLPKSDLDRCYLIILNFSWFPKVFSLRFPSHSFDLLEASVQFPLYLTSSSATSDAWTLRLW